MSTSEQTKARPQISFVLLSTGGLGTLAPTLRLLFAHPLVASYQVGFGPPLVRSSEQLIARVRAAKSALEKLDAYVDCCFLDDEEHRRLTVIFRRLMVRAHGPVEAEDLDDASAQVFDLVIRLHHPTTGPGAALDRWRRHDIMPDELSLHAPPEDMTGRIHVRLGDPRGARMFDLDKVRELATNPESDLAVEIRVPPIARRMFGAFLADICEQPDFRWIEVGEPVAHARVRRDSTPG